MYASKIKKVVYFKNEKAFASENGEVTHLFEESVLYDGDMDDQIIKSFYDDDVQDEMEVWTVRISIETI